ncbi:MAG: hypothetical protein ACRD23_04245 [Terriglobales bacterium]
MLTKLHVAAAVGLLLVLLAIFVCPAVDLPATALRSQQASMVLLLTMALCARCQQMRAWVAPVPQTSTYNLARSASVSTPSSLTGVLLC